MKLKPQTCKRCCREHFGKQSLCCLCSMKDELDFIYLKYHKRKISQKRKLIGVRSRGGIELIDLKHLEKAEESYVQHMKFALKISCRCLLSSVVLFIHALIPFLFPKQGLNMIRQIYHLIKSRGSK